MERIGVEENGEAKIKHDETIEFSLYEKDEQDNWSELEDVIWKANNDTEQDDITSFSPVINNDLSYITVKKDENSPEIRVDLNIKQEEQDINLTNTFNTEGVDVFGLDDADQPPAVNKFAVAIQKIKETSPGLYTTVSGDDINVKVHIVKASSMSSPDFAGITDRTTVQKEFYQFLGVDKFQLRGVGTVTAEQIADGTYKNKEIEDAVLVSRLHNDEIKNIKDASLLKDIDLLRTNIRDKIRSYNPDMEAELVNNVTNGTVTDEFLNTLKYKIEEADIENYMKLSSDFDVKINYEHFVMSEPNGLTKTVAHEYKHIDYGLHNLYNLIKWIYIRDTSNGETLFNLKDNEGSNGLDGCSSGPGHEKNNPENKCVCDEQDKY